MSGGGSADAARIGSIEPRHGRFEAESGVGALPRPCPVCRERNAKPHHGSGSPLRRCACGVVYMDPLPSDETIAAREDEAFHGGLREETAEMFSAYYRDYPEDAVVRAFRSNIQRLRMLTGGGTLLDVGVGTGLLLHLAREAGFTPLGIEISPDAAARASREFGVDVRVGAFETFRPDAPVDAIAMGDVLEHAGDPRRFLEHAASLLRPGGALWVAVPNCRSTMFWVADALARIPRLERLAGRIYVPNHYTYFTPATLARLVDEAGFAVGELRQDSPYLGRYRLSLPVKAALAALIAVGRATGLEARVEVLAVRR
jgi:2-polyprenyl-3-methyl-5-hydroxy-6-metoxy-1,4-benzoquinol methylase